MYKNKIRIIAFIAFIVLIVSCENKMVNSSKFIDSLSKDTDSEIPTVNESLIIFICKNENVYITSLRTLRSLNNGQFEKSKNFNSFLIDVLNNDLLSEAELKANSISTFSLNKTIVNEFNKKGIRGIIATYCEKTNVKGKFYLKNKLDLNIKESVMFFLFKSNYYIMQNDYLGKYVVINKN